MCSGKRYTDITATGRLEAVPTSRTRKRRGATTARATWRELADRARSTVAAVVPEVRTERLLLRDWRAPDRAPFAALNADPAVVEYLPGALDRRDSDDLAARIVAAWEQHGY